MDEFEPHLEAAFAALREARPKDAAAELTIALPILETAVAADATFLGVVTAQCAFAALKTGNQPLAQAYAALVLAQTARELEKQGTWHRSEAERVEREGRGAPDAAQLEHVRSVLYNMYTYAVAFVPFVHGQTLVAMLGRDEAPEQIAALKAILQSVRPALDAAGWSAWAYDPTIAQRAAYWAAYCFVHLGGLSLDNAREGRDIEDAERLSDGALHLIPDDARDHLQADAIGLKGRVLARYGVMQIDEAIACTERSLKILEALPDDDAATGDRVNLGAYYKMKADLAAANDATQQEALLAQAERYLSEAREAYRRSDPYGRLSGLLVNLSVVYTQRQKWDDAYRALVEADAALPEARYNFEIRAKIALNIGSLFNDTQRYSDAIPYFEKAFKVKPADGTVTLDPELEIMALGGLGEATLRSTGPERAEPHLVAALDAIEALRRSFFSERVNVSMLQRFRWIYETYVDCCAALGEHDPSYRSRAFETVEKLKWRTITTVLRYKSLAIVDEGDEPSIARERQLLSFLSTRLLGDPSAVKRDATIVEAMRQLDVIWDDLALRHPEYVAIRREETVDVPAALRALDEHVPAFVEYYLGDQYGTAVAFVLLRGETAPHVVRLPAGTARITELVATLRRQTTSEPPAAFRTASAALYDAIVAPLIDLIPEGAGICIIPYGQLHNAPFSGLWDGKRYLIERNPLTIAASISALRWWTAKDRAGRERCLVFAATSGIQEDDKRLADLDAFESLGRRYVAPLFPEHTVLAGADATKQRLVQALSPSQGAGPDVAHIACHGVAKPNGFASCLVMAGSAAAGAKDLTAFEIATGPQIDCSLVALSACHSAVSEASTGDDVAGLCPAFLLAGASSALATLWEIRQDAGDAILRSFYERWLKRGAAGDTKIACLQAAQCDALRTAGPLAGLKGFLGFRDDVSHPYLWSTLQLYGNWR